MLITSVSPTFIKGLTQYTFIYNQLILWSSDPLYSLLGCLGPDCHNH